MSLPYDYARCVGTTHATCANCQRREPGRPEWQSYISAPISMNGSCDYQIPYQTGVSSNTGAAK